jgi:carboxyl-terminal processing protease
MPSRYARLALLVLLAAAPIWAAAADDTLGGAYAAVLRGDYEGGRAAVARILSQGETADAKRAAGWLESYHQIVASRDELKARTFEWNVAQGHKAEKPFVALTFAVQAALYAPDPAQFASDPWVAELTARCRGLAAALEEKDRWSDALNYYVLLERLHKDDEEVRNLKERATRHARIEVAYKNEKALQERLRGVDADLLRKAVRVIDEMYYKEPDYNKLAAGALDNLLTLCGTKKLYPFLDGLGNPALREHFERKLTELRSDAQHGKRYTYKDLRAVYDSVANADKISVELPEGLLVAEFIEGMVGELDEYTGVIWPADAADFDKMMMGGFEGVGIQLSVDERYRRLKVVTPLENSPALEAGIQPDDLIVEVNGVDTKDWTTDDAVQKIMGKAGSEVVLTILRPRTGERLPFKLVRRRITLTTVRGVQRIQGDTGAWSFMLDKDAGVAYVRLTGFHPDSRKELVQALEQARDQGMKGLVLDIRHNPGGLLDVAINVVSTFLEQGEVVSTRGRQMQAESQDVTGKAAFKDVPLVVLVNEGSASASEILAGALQDHNRAIVLGERTFGKGSVQHVRPLSNSGEARIKLTTALYYLPSGRSPHKAPHAEKWGVDPDWQLKLTPKEFRRVLERERDSYVIHNEAAGSSSQPASEEERAKALEGLKPEGAADADQTLLSEEDIKLLESDPVKAPDTDPQLETALLLVRVKLAANVPWPREVAAAAQKAQEQ